jgi:hypothetical protein
MDNLGAGGGRRRGATRHSAEDQALDQIAKEVRVFTLPNFFHYFVCNICLPWAVDSGLLWLNFIAQCEMSVIKNHREVFDPTGFHPR